MYLFDNIYKFFTKSIDKKDISVNRDNYFLVNILSCFIIFWLIIFGTIQIFDGDWLEVSVNFSTALLIFVLYQIFIRTKKNILFLFSFYCYQCFSVLSSFHFKNAQGINLVYTYTAINNTIIWKEARGYTCSRVTCSVCFYILCPNHFFTNCF